MRPPAAAMILAGPPVIPAQRKRPLSLPSMTADLEVIRGPLPVADRRAGEMSEVTATVRVWSAGGRVRRSGPRPASARTALPTTTTTLRPLPLWPTV